MDEAVKMICSATFCVECEKELNETHLVRIDEVIDGKNRPPCERCRKNANVLLRCRYTMKLAELMKRGVEV